MHLAGFIIEIYYDSGPYERQIPNNYIFPGVSCHLF